MPEGPDHVVELGASTAACGGSDVGLTILHVVECWSGGVRQAVRSVAGSAPGHRHLLLFADGSEQGLLDHVDRSVFAATVPMAKGPVGRTRQLQRMVRAHAVDIVHAHSSWAGVYARSPGTNVPVVYQPHCYAFESTEGLRSTFFRLAERLLSRGSVVTVVLSEHERSLARSVAPLNAIVLIVNTHSLGPHAAPARDHPRRRVVMSGRLCPQKDPSFFLATAQAVWSSDPSIEFYWLGGGDTEASAVLEREGIHLSGWLSQQQLAAELRSSAVYLHSARAEGFPLSVLDAIEVGLPVIVREIPPFRGTGLRAVADARDAAALIVDVFTTPSKREELVASGAELRVAMAPDVQKRTLMGLYALAAGLGTQRTERRRTSAQPAASSRAAASRVGS